MDEKPDSLNCNFCGLPYILPAEDGAIANLPLVLLCGHIFCTSCVTTLEADNSIRCPECKVESALPELGVGGMEVDSRVLGLIYTAGINKKKSGNKGSRNLRGGRHGRSSPVTQDATTEEPSKPQPFAVEKVEKALEEGLAQAAENMAQLDHIHQTLLNGRKVQVTREKARLQKAINDVIEGTIHLLHQRKEALLSDLADIDAFFVSTNAEVSLVERRMKDLEIAMQKARQVQRFPALEGYCNLDTVLEILQRPVDVQSVDQFCITMDSGLSCVLQSDSLSKCLNLFLKLEANEPKPLTEDRVPSRQQEAAPSSRKTPWRWYQPPPVRRREFFRRRAGRAGGRCPAPRPGTPHPKSSHARRQQQLYPAEVDTGPDVVVEEEDDMEMEEEELSRWAEYVKAPPHALKPTAPGLASNKGKTKWKKKVETTPVQGPCRTECQLVQVLYVVNPNHFYVRYHAERKHHVTLTRKISENCCGDESLFSLRDTIKTGGVVCVRAKEGVWCRATVEEIMQRGTQEVVTSCPVTKISSLRMFLVDYGFAKYVRFESEKGMMMTDDSILEDVHEHLRKVGELLQKELRRLAPQAIKCSLKDLIPVDLIRGWSREARSEFRNVVGSALVEMKLYGQDKDCLLVDLGKAPMDKASKMPISVREYLIFLEVARFYTPLPSSRTPLQYYPCNYPKVGRECNAVVTHINSPSDFYIQLIDSMEFLLLSNKLQEFYSSLPEAEDNDLQLYCPVLQQACVARYDDQSWNRAKVMGHPGGRKVEVMYVDFGNTDILSVSELRKIKDEFFALPIMAIQCCLSNVLPHDGVTWSETSIKRFHSLTFQKPGVTVLATARVPRSKPLPVSLYESSVDGPLTNINELLITEELACFRTCVGDKDPEPCVEDSPVWDPPLEGLIASGQESLPVSGGASDRGSLRDQSLDTVALRPNLELPTSLDELKVRVTHVNSPGSFYVQLTRNSFQFKKLCELLKQDYVSTEAQDIQWEADMFCAVLNNGCWERGQICNTVASTNMAEVRRCDYGNNLSVHISNLRPLQASLVGSLALECTLCDIRPAGGSSTWTATSCDFMSYYVTGAMATMTIKELTEQRPLPVSLCCSNQAGKYTCIADFLVSEGLALKERKKRETPTTVKTEEGVSGPRDSGEIQEDVVPAVDDSLTPPPTPPPPPPSSPAPSSPTLPVVIPKYAPKPAPRTAVSAEKVKTALYQPPELPCHGPVRLSISAVGDDGVIYVRTYHAVHQLEQLKSRMQQDMKTLAPVPRQYKSHSWRSVQGCVVMGPDMHWHRGLLLEIISGHIRVRYVDSGQVDNFPFGNMCPTLLCEDIPQLCIPCQLYGLIPVGMEWHSDAVALLRHLLVGRSLDMLVMELPLESRGCVTVQIFLDGISLSRIMCHHQHAIVDMTVPLQEEHVVTSTDVSLDEWDIDTEGLEMEHEPVLGPFSYPSLPKEGEHFRVRVKHLCTPNEVFLVPVEEADAVLVNGETLEEAMNKLNANKDSLRRLSNYPFGGVCLAEYGDGRYYRSKMMDFVSVDPPTLLVQHVDFGSDDTVPTCKLRQMPAELLRFPASALKVLLSGFRPPRVSQETEMLPYRPEWSVKAAQVMIDLLHGKITASVVAREPELTVLLYDEKGELVHLPLVNRLLADSDRTETEVWCVWFINIHP